jgi:hypothetical protein
MFLHMSFLDGYRIISWFSWTSNLAVAEIYLNRATLRGVFVRRIADRMLSVGPQ